MRKVGHSNARIVECSIAQIHTIKSLCIRPSNKPQQQHKRDSTSNNNKIHIASEVAASYTMQATRVSVLHARYWSHIQRALLFLSVCAVAISSADQETVVAGIADTHSTIIHKDQVPTSGAADATATNVDETQALAPIPSTASALTQQHDTTTDTKTKRDTKGKLESLLSQESILPLHHPPPPPPPAYSQHGADVDYNYDSGKNIYGKQANDWSLYDQGNHGIYDKYGDKAWTDQGHNAHSNHGKHDSYGNSYNSHGANHGSGYYSRDRGYGYEKHYAYDKEVASKQHADQHNSYGSQQGLHDHYGNSGSQAHAHHGHDRYGQLSRYGNHGYGKRGSSLGAHQDYGHTLNKGHYYAQSAPQYSQYSSSSSHGDGYASPHVPTYRSTYSDYGPQIGYPSSYPSYY